MPALRSRHLALALMASCLTVAVYARDPEGGQLSGGRPKFGPPPGAALFTDHCAMCHNDHASAIGGRVPPSQTALAALPPERIFDTLVNGKMQQQAEGLSRVERREIAEFVARRQITDASGTDIKVMHHNCPLNPAFRMTGAAWNGWSAAGDNARFQRDAGLSAAQVPHLRLKWAFGLPQGASSFSQPTIAGGRVFVAGDNGTLYALDARSGCAYWSFAADSAVRSAPIVRPIAGHGANRYAVFFASGAGSVYAVDAGNGHKLWQVKPGPAVSGITGSPAYAAGRLYIPYVGTETLAGADPKYPCCSSRGAVASLDANTGARIWLVDTIQQPLASRGKNEIGTPLQGPAGASVWNSPTVDLKRGLIYVGTGNGYTEPAAATSDSVVALDIATGAIRWHHQEIPQDAFVLGCPDTSPAGRHCPTRLGPDWDFGGGSVILHHGPDGHDVLLAAGKAGIAIALDPDHAGQLVWRHKLWSDHAPTADGLVVFGGAADATRVYYPLQRAGGGLTALDIATGREDWTAALDADGRGQVSPASAIPGVVFTGGWDGVLRAVGGDGKVLWRYDTRRDFTTVNGVKAHGGSIGSSGVTVADGVVYLASGYIGMQQGSPGNVVLAFSVR